MVAAGLAYAPRRHRTTVQVATLGAIAVLLIMLSEQAFLNAGPLIARGLQGAAAAGFIFNVLMIARAPVVLFQAAATSLLPHLTRLRSTGDESSEDAFRLSVRVTLAAIAGFAALTMLAVLVAGPPPVPGGVRGNFCYHPPRPPSLGARGPAGAAAESVVGGDPATNAALARRVLDGEHGPHRDIVVLNAAAALVVAGVADDLKAGLDTARAALDEGRAAAALDRLVAVSNAA